MAAPLSSSAYLVRPTALARRSSSILGMAEAFSEIGASLIAETAEIMDISTCSALSSAILRSPSVSNIAISTAILLEGQVADSFLTTEYSKTT